MPKSNIEKQKFFAGLISRGGLIVTEAGEVTNPTTGRRIGYKSSTGYLAISYSDKATGIIWKIEIHRLVWIAFRGLIPQDMEVNHRDEDRHNPCLSNLDLVSRYKNLWWSKNGGSYDDHLPVEAVWAKQIEDGSSCGEIARTTGLASSSVSRRLKKYGLIYRHPMARRRVSSNGKSAAL